MSKTIEVIKVNKPGNIEGNSTAPTKRRVAAYARVSTDYEDQLNSYKAQCEEYTKVIEANPSYIFAGLFADQGISGTSAKKRPEFMKMIESARNGNLDLILTKSISRFGRNTVDVITYIRELRELNVEIFFEKENISSLDSKIDFMLTILSSIAQEESRAISSNVKWSYDKKFKNGIVDARRIYGYEVIDGKFSILEDEAKVVRDMFSLALKRYNINDIRKTLNKAGIQAFKGGDWTYGSIRHILQNEKYCGDAMLRKTVCVDYLTKKTVKNDNIADKYYVSNNHEAIVSKETFEMVQLILNDKSSFLRNQNKTTTYPLTGILYCPKCHRTLKRQLVSKDNLVLNCNHSYHNDYICDVPSPKYDLVVGAASESIRELYANKNALDSLFKVFDNNVALNELRARFEEFKATSKTLYEQYESSPSEEISKEITRVNEEIEVIQKELSQGVSTSLRLDYIKSLVSSDLATDSIQFKDIYSIILADDKLVRFVISSKTITELIKEIPSIILTDSILRKMHYSSDGNSGIIYEVIIYE